MQEGETSFLKDLWYCAGPARLVRPGAMIHRTLLGEPVLLARGHDGQAFALRDLCPHRGVPLSAGAMCRDGGESQVECPYHGWRFGGDGKCRTIPSLVPGQDLDPARIAVRSYPLTERQGLLWVYMAADPQRTDIPPEAPPEIPLVGEASPKMWESMVFHCDVDHAVIGLMDPAHGPFVHRSWYWRSARSIHEKAKAFRPSHLGFTMSSHKPSSNSALYKLLGGEVTTEISFLLPGIRIEKIRVGRHHVVGLTTVTPVDATETEVRQYFYWDMGWLGAIRPFFRPFARAFLDQDRRMVDLQAEGLKFDPRLMLIDDADTQAKWYHRLKREWETSRAEGRPFEHPIREETVLRWRS
jgi:phenylpropionate dioxygenase-like ring-hydroxylating dioxygenase large terminal subunit